MLHTATEDISQLAIQNVFQSVSKSSDLVSSAQRKLIPPAQHWLKPLLQHQQVLPVQSELELPAHSELESSSLSETETPSQAKQIKLIQNEKDIVSITIKFFFQLLYNNIASS